MSAVKDVVKDEVEFLQSLVSLEGAALLELGCGKAEFARKLLQKTRVQSITALEVDRVQHRLNLEAPADPRLVFGYGAAEAIPFDDATFDGVLMMKSLHHVPVESMQAAFAEIRRVLKPGGWLYVSEPVFAGPLNDIIKLFHDEGAVREAAYRAIGLAASEGVMQAVSEHAFEMPAHYAGFDDFVAKHVAVTHSERNWTPEIAERVRTMLAAHTTTSGADFMRPMRVNLMRRLSS
jgi:ubiquinone/menaquinone biosynthesis C-methylase UbiE